MINTLLAFSTALLMSPVMTQTQAADCSIAYDQPCDFAVEKVCFADHPHQLTVEIADTFGKRSRGLMYRTELGEHQGMLFRYPSLRSGDSGFWMFNTLIPLDIAYLDADNRIVKIMTMVPCGSIDPRNCPAYNPETPFKSALEMPAGYFQQYGIQSGRQLQTCDSQENNS